jgi:hypothetical protein
MTTRAFNHSRRPTRILLGLSLIAPILLLACAGPNSEPIQARIDAVQSDLCNIERGGDAPEAVRADSITGIGPQRDALASRVDHLADDTRTLSNPVLAHRAHDEIKQAADRIRQGDYRGAEASLRQAESLEVTQPSSPGLPVPGHAMVAAR